MDKAGWEQQEDNEHRRYVEEERMKEERAWFKHWRESWERWMNTENGLTTTTESNGDSKCQR